MLTRTKKWLSVIVLALVTVLLISCTEKTVKPTAIEISMDVYVGEEGVEVGGDVMMLSVVTTPANADKTVTWSSADTSIATVNAQGEVTGLKPGKVKIKAVSTVDETVFGEVEVMVYESLKQNIVLVNAMNEIKGKVPAYVNDSFQLPTPSNPFVKAEYFDIQGNKFNNNVYTYLYAYDAIETVNVKLTYMNEVLEFTVMFNVVEDLEINEFKALEAAEAYLEEFLAPLKQNKVKENVQFPSEFVFGEGENAQTVKITYTTDSTTLTSAGVYNRPNDDTQVALEAYLTVDKVSKVSRHKLISKGYDKAEIIQYLKDNVFPKVTEVQGANLTLAQRDGKFNTTISWTSSNEDVMKTNGKMNAFLDKETAITLTATINYAGTLNSTFAFTETVTFEILVKPATSNAQKVVLDLANRIDDMDFPFYFPYGVKDRVGGNVLPLPTKVGGESSYKDIDITWTAGEEGLFNENWELQKQYLRYHEVILTYTVTVEGETATGEVIINVGITKVANTLYVGGRFVVTNMGGTQVMDGLHTFSIDDGATTTPYGQWNGITFYIDAVENGVTTRYQYFATDKYYYRIFEGEGGVTIDENGLMTGKVLGQTGDTNPSYQYVLYHNDTDKDVKLPIVYLNYKGSTLSKDVNDQNLIRQTSISFDGWRMAFTTDKDGKVVFGFGADNIETGLGNAAEKAEDGSFVLPEYVTIPAGGFGWSPLTNQNNTKLAVYTTVGNQLTFEVFQGKYVS